MSSTSRPAGNQRTSSALVLGLLLTVTSLAACASAPLATSSIASAPCDGTEIAVVRNESGSSIDVFSVQGSAESFVGTARTGRSELALPPATGRRFVSARTQDGGLIPVGRPAKQPNARVEIDVVCRAGNS